MNSLCNLKFATFISMICLLSACTANSGGAEPVQRATDVDNDSNLCPSLPSTFTNADLIGTWVARYGLDNSDTLTIRSDGTYRQVYEKILTQTSGLKATGLIGGSSLAKVDSFACILRGCNSAAI